MNLVDHSPGTWPQVPFRGLRLWCSNTRWDQLNPAPGQYDWTELDHWLSTSDKHGGGADFLLTLAMTPRWASSNPHDLFCHAGPGACDPPDDLNPDGSGTDQHWKDFVSAVAHHVNGRIWHWEVWNEPHEKDYWNGTYAQMARMAKDARTIVLSVDPHARLLNGGVQAHQADGRGLKWWNGYAAAGGLQWADVIALHGDVRPSPPRCGEFPQAEEFAVVMQNLQAVLAKYGQQNKPIWDTEASWGRTDQDCFTDQDLQAAFLARFYFLHRSLGVKRFYWRAWIDGHGGLYDPGKGINKAGVAYGQVYDWLMTHQDLTMTPCSANGTVWTCDFTGPDGYVARAVWDTSQTCKNGTCETNPYAVDSQYVDYLTLDGNKIEVSNHRVPIGAKPIWLEN